MGEPYLTVEEQFKDVLTDKEILRIRDCELRRIRQKYWDLKDKVFHDEQRISDQEFEDIVESLMNQEKAEILQYRQRKGL